jgi:fatty-acyl-CoA synthase
MSTHTSSVASATRSVVMGEPLSAEASPGSLTIPGYLKEVTARFGAREALVLHTKDEVAHWSYQTLWDHSAHLARALLAAGVGKDSRIGVLMSNRPEFVASVFGVALAGGVAVVLSTFCTAAELEHLIKVSGVSILLYESKVSRKDFDEVLLQLEPAISNAAPLLSAKFPFLRHLVRLDPHRADSARAGAIESWSDFLERANEVPLALVEAAAATVKPSDAALLFFSSGTTGVPKGILHAQQAAAIQWWRWPRVLGVTGDVRCWTANGFFWSGQLSMALGCGLSTGGTVVLQPTFDPEEALELLQKERVTIPFAWPHQWARLEGARNWNDVNLGSLCYVDPRSPLARHPTVRTTGWHEPPAYGATETFTIVAAMPDFRPAAGTEHLQGPPLPGNTLVIVDPLGGAVVPRGQRGEIAVKGPTLMLGYIGTPLAETLDAEGYFHTGDGGYIDESGRLFWEGRLSDIIKTGGANVSPREIDSILLTYPGIKLSRTVGVPHDTLGEMVVACLVPHEGAQLEETLIRDFLKARLASYKVPRRLLFFEEQEIAMTGSDKVKADALVRRATEKLARG